MRCKAIIDPEKTYASISPLIYGQCLEHTGACIYGGLWAEMLRDRKFFHSPDDDLSPWTVPSGSVEMVASTAYAGEQSPTVWLPGSIAQSGLRLEAGREYVVRLVLACASLRGIVEVSLCWGNSSHERISHTIERIGKDYQPVSMHLTPTGSSMDGRIEIAGHGKGALRIGAVSLMPADNVRGMRREALDAFRRLNASLYSWPGGDFTDTYSWRDGVGDRDRRPPRFDPTWQHLESNDFGFDEFAVFCEEVGAEPLVIVNGTEGNVRLAVDEVRFANDPAGQGPAKLRLDSGRETPYNIALWGMGRQQHRTLQLAATQLEEFRKRHNAMAEAMRAADPDIRLVCLGGKKDFWREAILAGCALNVDMISEQCCCKRDGAVEELMQSLTGDVRECTLAYRELMQTLPEMRDAGIQLAIDRWCFAFNRESCPEEAHGRLTWAHGLGLAAGVHQIIRDSDVLRLAAYALAIGELGAVAFSDNGACLTAAGQVLSLYRNHFGVHAIAIKEECEPLDVVAAWTSDHSALTLGVINPLQEDSALEIALRTNRRLVPETSWLATAPTLDACNSPGHPETITLEERPVNYDNGLLLCPPISAGICRLRLE